MIVPKYKLDCEVDDVKFAIPYTYQILYKFSIISSFTNLFHVIYQFDQYLEVNLSRYIHGLIDPSIEFFDLEFEGVVYKVYTTSGNYFDKNFSASMTKITNNYVKSDEFKNKRLNSIQNYLFEIFGHLEINNEELHEIVDRYLVNEVMEK